MTALARAVVRLYPAAWRQRYEDEVLELIDASPLRAGDVAELVHGLLVERWRALILDDRSPRRTEAVLVLFGPVVLLSVVLAATGGGLMVRAATGPWPDQWIGIGEWVLFGFLFGDILLRGIRHLLKRPLRVARSLPSALLLLFVVVAVNAWGDLLRLDTYRVVFADWFGTVMVVHLFWLAGLGLTHGLWPDRSILDAIERVEVAAGQLAMSRAWVRGCHTSIASGIPSPLDEAGAGVARWQAELAEARAALEARGYHARFRAPEPPST